MTLTEQWKKGELKEGWYYIRNKAHSIKFNQMAFFMVFGEVSYWTNCKDEDVKEVLAPVPSYEEWQDTENRSLLTTEFSNEIDELNEENQQLKELLKEAKDIIEWYKADCGYKDTPTEAVLTKIDNAIGEKK